MENALPLKDEVIDYIERCHLDDGGYFFARVPPSSNMDTFYAVKCLSILGAALARRQEIGQFFLDQMRQTDLNDITGLFSASEVLSELGMITGEFKKYAYQKIMRFKNNTGGFGATENVDVEVVSELQNTYRAVKVLKLIGKDFDKVEIARFVFGLLNRDGGYGRDRNSQATRHFCH